VTRKPAIEMALGKRLLLGEMVTRSARKFPDREAMIFGDTRLTYKQFNTRINRLSHGLMNLGIKKGSKVAILAYNCNQFMEVYFALAKIGAVAVPLNFRLHPEEFAYIVDNSDAEAFIVGGAFVDTVESIKNSLPRVKKYISLTEKPVKGMLHYETWIAEYPDNEPLIPVKEDDPAFIMYTAGTTGRPKGAVLTHKNEVVMCMLEAMWVASEPGIRDLSNSIALTPPPIFHLAAFAFSQICFFFGATLVFSTEVFDPVNIMETIQKEKVTAILLIPAMTNFLLLLPDLDKYDTSSLQIWISGGAILPTETRRLVRKNFPSVKIFDMFGQTEMSPVVSGLRPSESDGRESSVGKPLTFIELRVVDENDNEVPVGAVGEATYRGPTVMKEYYKNPKATREAMRNGWFHGGDLVRRDEAGYIYVVDRKKDMIISGGENIYSKEVEDVINSHPLVLESAVIGVKDAKWGESVKAIVVLIPNEDLSAEALIDHCKKNMASYKKPKYVEFVDSLPRNPSGKVLKAELRKRYGKN
jgi:fatty-acyl-CoA synthase